MSSSSSLQTEAEAFAFRKLLEHMKWRNETIQNIEMMNLTGFCRNCLAKWLLLGKKNARLKSTYEMCQEEVYGMTQKEWKEKWQMKATEEVLEKFKSGQEMHAKHPKDLMEAVAALPLQPRANNNNNNNNKNNTRENNTNMLSDVCCEDIEGEEVCVTRDTVDGTVHEGFYDYISFGIITVSDRAFNGVYEDISGNVVMRETIETYFKTNDRDDSINSTEIIRGYKLVPDEIDEIAKAISYMSDELKCDVVLTTGGTGLAKRDVTPEATKSVLTREVKGIAESLRAHARRYERHAALSRAVAGLRNDQSLIVNLPGRPNAVSSSLAVLLPMLPHAVRQMKS